MIKSITTDALSEALAVGTDNIVLDVREVDEFEAGHIEDAVNVPLSLLEQQLSSLNKEQAYYVICKKGGRSMQASSLMDQAGYDVTNVEGGMDAWTGQTI